MPTHADSLVRLLARRLSLLDSGFYLGDSHVLNNVESFEPAPLCAIATIDRNDFWLTPLAGYHKPSAIWHDLASVKPSCAITQPSVQPVKEEFNKVIQNLRRLQDSIATPGYQVGKGFILAGGQTGNRLKLRHLLFESLDGRDSADQGFSETLLGDDNIDVAPFTIDNWLVDDDETRDELETLKATHHLVPLPTYDIDGNLIQPHAYRQSLQGALVELYFNMSHWAIAGKGGTQGNDVFTAEIQMIRIIEPPRQTVMPNKRKGDENHNGVPSPDSPSEDPFSFEQWPLTRERHHADLLTLKSTHRLLPVPAYDLEGNFLKPSTYCRYLQGALVEIHFTHGGEIELIRLLELPPATSATVQKRKLPLHLDADEGPTKKRAVA
ncbi:hypothetical protein EDD15DRAFT_2366981 [Pisolithus albus]|nr:hypothetical protein EDD15DRAFT_2366981 [Pisolithus albus]